MKQTSSQASQQASQQTSPRTDVRVVLMTVPDEAAAERLATSFVEERLCACVNILPRVTSIYRWQGNVERQGELLMVLKTTTTRLPTLIARAQELHPYEVPELLALSVEQGLPAYLAWIVNEIDPVVI